MPAGISNWMTLDKRFYRAREKRDSYFLQRVPGNYKSKRNPIHGVYQMCNNRCVKLVHGSHQERIFSAKDSIGQMQKGKGGG